MNPKEALIVFKANAQCAIDSYNSEIRIVSWLFINRNI